LARQLALGDLPGDRRDDGLENTPMSGWKVSRANRAANNQHPFNGSCEPGGRSATIIPDQLVILPRAGPPERDLRRLPPECLRQPRRVLSALGSWYAWIWAVDFPLHASPKAGIRPAWSPMKPWWR
jgi:hypothetical protein